MKAQGPGHHMGVTKDRSEHRIVGQTTELNLDSCALSSTRVSTFGKYEEQTLNELNFAADSSEDSTPADQELTLQDDESFSPVSATRLPPAVSHRLNTSTDDESFLPPSAFQPCPVGNCELNNSSNLPEAQYSPVEPLHVQRATINLYEEKEVFKEDDTFVDTEWVSELNCTCTSKDQSQSNEPLANTMLDLAKDKGFCDSELLIRPSKGKGIDITSPNNIYVFERKNPTPLHNMDKTTAFLLEDTLDYTMGTVNDGYAPHTDTAQGNSGDSKASVSISGSSSSLYCSCANGSVVFSCAVGNFGHTSHTQQAPEDPMSQAEKDQCLVRPTPSGRDQDKSVSECTGELATHNIQLVHTRDLQTLPFKDTQLFDEMLRDSPLRRTSEQPNCNSPSPQRQCSYHDASLSHSTLINPSDNDIVQSSCAGSTCTNSCVNKGLLNAVPRNAVESNPAMFPATDAHSQNHKCKRGDHSVAELVSITGRIEDGNFPGLLMLPTKKSLSSNETSLGASPSDSVSIKYSVGNKAETCSDEEDSSIEDGKEDEGSSGLEQLLKKIKIPTETGLSQIDADRLSPFVTPRTKSRLANNSLRSCSSSLFEQTLAMPVRIRRVREQQMEDARSPSGCFDSLSNESAVSHGAEDEGETRSCAHSPDSEDADFDTVPFVRCNECEKWTVRPPAALCPDQEEANFDTVPFLNTKHEKGTTRSSLPGHDANRNKQCVRLKSEADANKGSQAGPVPHPVNLEEYGDANQGGCFYPPIDQSAPVAVQTDIEANSVGQMRSNTAFGGDVLWSSEDNDLQRELRISTIEQGLFGAVELPLARSLPSSQCRSPVPLAGEAEAETGAFPRNSNVCESTRLEGVDLQLGNRHQTCNFSKRSIEERLSKIPNDNAEWQSLLGNLDLQLSPGGRPVDSSVSETVEYLYTDPEEGHTLIERRYPCKDASSENLSTSGSEETVIYDWRAYKNRKFCAKVGKNMLPSDELPKLSPRLLLLSNSQIRRQLKDYGEDPGPITALTRKVYLHLLDRVRKEPVPRKPQQFSSLQMLTNKKRGDYYGVAAAWPMKRRRQLGVHMLCRALQIFLAEGERQLRPADIRIGQ
ncbi:hypothetical protein scyTo_0005824 [Scyliorhinus torazame]|uniref:LEM domain-containing protein n=1 Tax=Scyliorhinus torazame TaxID=75743 RepID=A0A401PD50_SCYTO|nr:hypothetical protein [Scyliorhinus torazame]